MSVKRRKFQKGIRIKKENIEGAGGEDLSLEGEIGVDSDDDKLKARLGDSTRKIVTADQAETLTNKTIDSATNTITVDADEATVENLEVDNLKAGVLDTDLNAVSASHDTIPSAKATKDYVDAQILTKDEASEIAYNPAGNPETTATDVQAALDDTGTASQAAQDTADAAQTNLDNHIADAVDAHDASAISNVPSGNLAATDVQSALNELQGDIDTTNTNLTETDTNANDLVTLSGVAENSTNLGTFTGTTISDNNTIKGALQELESATETGSTDLTNHLNDAADAHDASAISADNSGNSLTSTDVQASLTEVAGRLDTTESNTTTNATNLTNHLNDAVDAHDASAISNVPSGNLAATDVQAALNELQTDIDTRATSTDLSNHTGASTGVHGVTGSVVGTTDTQDLSNKTFTDAITIEELASTPSTPAAGDKKFYAKNDGKVYTLNSAGEEVEVGSGGGATQFEINQVAHGLAIGEGIYHNVSSWVKGQSDNQATLAYYVVIEVIDADNFIAGDFGRVEVPLHGFTPGSYYFLSDSVAGQPTTAEPASGFSNPLFYVEDANIIQLKCLRPNGIDETTLDQLADVSVPTPTDAQLLTYNNANSRWEAADAPISITNDTKGQIQTHDASAPASLDVGPNGAFLQADSDEPTGLKWNTSISGTLNPVTDWQEYTPTLVAFGSVSNVSFAYRRVGDTLQVKGTFVPGAATNSNATISLPTGLTYDNTKPSGRTGNESLKVGHWGNNQGVNNQNAGFILADISASNILTFSQPESASGFSPMNTAGTGEQVTGTATVIGVDFEVPIQGWSSGVDAAVTQSTLDLPNVTQWENRTTYANSNILPTGTGTAAGSYTDYRTRRVGDSLEVSFAWTKGGVAGTGTNAIAFPLPDGLTALYDEFRIGEATTYGIQHVDPADPEYNTTGVRTQSTQVILNKLGTGGSVLGEDLATNAEVYANFRVPIVGWTATETQPAVIAGTFENINSSNLVVVRGIDGTVNGFTTSTSVPIPFVEVEDDQNAWDGSVFTAPKAGEYLIKGAVNFNTSATRTLNLYKNGTLLYEDGITNNDSRLPFSFMVHLEQGDTADIRPNIDSDLFVGASSNERHWIHIQQMADTESIITNLAGALNAVTNANKGDLQTHDGTNNTSLPVGTDGTFLVADSTQSNGLKWTDSISGTLNPVTDWASFTPNLLNGGSPSAITGRYRRVGDSVQVQVMADYNGGSADAGTSNITFDPLQDLGLTIDATKITQGSTFNNVGSALWYDDSGNLGGPLAAMFDQSAIGGAGGVTFLKKDSNSLVANNIASPDRLSFNITLPIQGWSSGVDAAVQNIDLNKDTVNELSARVEGTTGNVFSENYNGWLSVTRTAAGQYTLDYSALNLTTVPVLDIRTESDEQLIYTFGASATAENVVIRNHPTSSTITDQNFIVKLSKQGADVNTSQVIAGTFENINSSELYKFRAGVSPTITDISNSGWVTIPFNNEEYDNLNAYNGGTFTAPRDGYYRFNCKLVFDIHNWTAGASISLRVQRSIGSEVYMGSDTQITAYNYYRHFGSHSTELFLSAGETAQIQLSHSGGVTGVDILASTTETYLEISELPDTESIIKNLNDNNNVKFQTKYCNAIYGPDVSTVPMPTLNFSNLTEGKRYKLEGQFDLGGGALVTIVNGSQTLARPYVNSVTEVIFGVNSIVFTATATTITVTKGAGGTVWGTSGTGAETFLTLYELPDNYVETNEF